MGALWNLIPLIVIFVIIAIGAFVGYQIYLFANDVADKGRQGMEKRHMHFTKEGMKVDVKHVDEDEYSGKAQDFLVKTWNHSSFPAYKSRLWNSLSEEDAAKARSKDRLSPRPSSSRHASGERSHSSSRTPSEHRGHSTATTSTGPGSARPKTVSRTSSSPAPGAFPD